MDSISSKHEGTEAMTREIENLSKHTHKHENEQHFESSS